MQSCADPGIFSSGVQVSLTKKLILQKSNGQFQRNLSFFKVPEGVKHFPGRGPTFSREGDPIPIETHIAGHFPGGGGGVRTPCPPSGSAHNNTLRTSNSFVRSDTGVAVIGSEPHLCRMCKTSLLFAPLAARVYTDCSAFPFYTPTKPLIQLHIKYKTVFCSKL